MFANVYTMQANNYSWINFADTISDIVNQRQMLNKIDCFYAKEKYIDNIKVAKGKREALQIIAFMRFCF